jgi:hypothetical protein
MKEDKKYSDGLEEMMKIWDTKCEYIGTVNFVAVVAFVVVVEFVVAMSEDTKKNCGQSLGFEVGLQDFVNLEHSDKEKTAIEG